MKNKFYAKFIAVLFFSMFFTCAYCIDSVRKDIKVGIIINADSFTAANTKDFFITDSTGKNLKLTKGNVKLSFDGKNLTAGKYSLSLPVRIDSKNGLIFADKKAYRGYLTVNKSGNKINVINILPVDDYLKGVLPKEAPTSWKIETLKAQAVISRTYLLANLNKHSAQGFDLCSTTHCQVYGGAEGETVPSNTAVVKTKNEVLTFDGKLANTFFHANCAGHTEDPKYVWGLSTTPAYLLGVKCGYCSGTPHSNWESSIDESFIIKKLETAGHKVGAIQSIKIKDKTKAGMAKEIEIKHSKGTLVMNANKFRLAVDAWQVKSVTLESIKKQGNKFVFKGSGWGHKVGLCQWGAKGMGDAGKTYKQILAHYYPKTKLEKVVYK
ncbi:MAG: SpoIID/LytB domain-containing protein [Endomicrobia bacterium]|nr:SpoIID/LytB domain-containing protein [Endomicrobiia bacterium]MCL2506535.1 SpoIID/LytB domain-containing protein [Endomicrobiia bacterium]